jgi:hypothetical protein
MPTTNAGGKKNRTGVRRLGQEPDEKKNQKIKFFRFSPANRRKEKVYKKRSHPTAGGMRKFRAGDQLDGEDGGKVCTAV